MTNKERKYAQSMKKIYNSTPTMIHERDYVPKNCVFCFTRMKTIHDTHNPHPVADFIYAKESNETDVADRCCTSCDEKVVLPARLEVHRKALKPNEKKRFVIHADMIERPNSTMHLRNPVPSVLDDFLTIVHPLSDYE